MNGGALALGLAIACAACGGAVTPGEPVATATPTAASTTTPTSSAAGSPTARPSPLVSAKGNIVVTAPLMGDVIASPVTITGEASVFEGNVVFRVITTGGNVLGQGHVTASAGAPQRGTFKADLAFDTPLYGGSGFVEVYEVSAKDGTVSEIVRVPVTIPGTY